MLSWPIGGWLCWCQFFFCAISKTFILGTTSLHASSTKADLFPLKRRHPQFIQGEVVEICDSLEAGSFSEASLAALQQLFTKCLEVSPMSTPDLVLSLEEVPWSQCHCEFGMTDIVWERVINMSNICWCPLKKWFQHLFFCMFFCGFAVGITSMTHYDIGHWKSRKRHVEYKYVKC